MKIIIAPQSFKGCASALTIASTIAAGVHRAFPKAELLIVPIADGGDDTLDILLAAKGGLRYLCSASGPLNKPKSVYWGALTNAFPKIAIIESARVCGLASLENKNRNPLFTTTYGLGELINDALKNGYNRLFIGLGGSATNDAGTGMAQALGVRFLDSKGKELPKGGKFLIHLDHIDVSNLNPLIHNAEFIAGCDVNNPLLGPSGASLVFSPQKGASIEMAGKLEKALENFTRVVKKQFHIDLAKSPFLGSSGGTAASLLLFCQAQLVSGAQWILNEIGFDQMLVNADLVITGEGCIDFQTASNKAPFAVAQIAKKKNIPVIAIVGSMGAEAEVFIGQEFNSISASSQFSKTIPKNALQLIQKTAENAVKLFN